MGPIIHRSQDAGRAGKVKAACKELEAKMGSSLADEPGFMPAARPVTFRAYRVENEWFKNGKRVIDLEVYFRQHDKRLFVERLRKSGSCGGSQHEHTDRAGRRSSAKRTPRIHHRRRKLDRAGSTRCPAPGFSCRKVTGYNHTQDGCRQDGCSYPEGKSSCTVSVSGASSAPEYPFPVLAQTVVDAGDVIEVVGTRQEVEAAAKRLGYIDRPTNQTDMIFVGLGILVGGLFESTFRPYRRHPHQLEHKRRRIDCGLVLRLAPQ